MPNNEHNIMDLKNFRILGLLYFCQQIFCADIITPSSLQDLTSYNTEQLQNTLSSSIVSNYIWSPTTQPSTRLYPVNTTQEGNDLASISDFICSEDASDDNYKVESYNGDIIVSVILHDSENAASTIKFIVDRINSIGLLAHNTSIGVRILHVMKSGNLSEVLESEIDYLEHCTENPFGIFLFKNYWHHINSNNSDLKLWPVHDVENMRMQKIAQLLNQLPLSPDKSNISVELKTDTTNRAADFEKILEKESLCFKNFPSKENLFVYIGNEVFFESVQFATNHSLIIVPLTSREIQTADIPYESFIIQENKMENLSYPSTFISIGATFLEISNSINKALLKVYSNASAAKKINLTKCEICNDLEVFGDVSYQNPKKMLNVLQLNALEDQMNYVLYKKSSLSNELKRIVTTNYVTNETTIYIQDQSERITLGSLFRCVTKADAFNSSLPSGHNESHHTDAFIPNEVFNQDDTHIDLDGDFAEMYWELKSELWVAIGLTMSTLGILLSMAILTFIIIRICMDDVLEGNPIGSIVMLIALIAQFVSFFPFTIEYASSDIIENHDVMNSMCIIKLFLVSVSYCLTFSLLLSRAIMLASIGSEGGFLSHVNGYIQSIICFFSFIVQLGLSIQFLIMMQANSKNVTCLNIYHGNWFWAVISYDAFILIMLVALAPFIFKSQRNYHEGVLIVITSILCVICWTIWIPLSMIDDYFREVMISLGVQTTAWIILGTLMVPRCFLIVKSIARTDFAQALPSLTSLAFAQANQFISDPSIYECVNPTMHTRSIEEESEQTNLPNESYQSPNDVPTLPLRAGRRSLIEHYNLNFNEIVNPNLPSPNKMTRF